MLFSLYIMDFLAAVDTMMKDSVQYTILHNMIGAGIPDKHDVRKEEVCCEA